MPTTNSWNNRCDLLTGSSTVKATHPRGNLRRDNGPLSLYPTIAFALFTDAIKCAHFCGVSGLRAFSLPPASLNVMLEWLRGRSEQPDPAAPPRP
jgi:hypothetical protein